MKKLAGVVVLLASGSVAAGQAVNPATRIVEQTWSEQAEKYAAARDRNWVSSGERASGACHELTAPLS